MSRSIGSEAIDPAEEFRAELLDERLPEDQRRLEDLRTDPRIRVLDQRDDQRAELQRVLPTPPSALLYHPGLWAYYQWRRTMVGVLGPDAFRLLRLDRNRNKITHEEQEWLGRLRVGVVGLSVGHAIAHTLAMEGLCAEIRLADFDTIDLSNLNRIPATVFDLGLNKAVVAARRITELDPYLTVSVYTDGLTTEAMAGFLDGLDVVIEECDSLDMKLVLRAEARARRLPVLMETSDRGLLDVERFDLEPDRPLLHGLVGNLDAQSLAGLSMREKVPHLLRLLDASALSARMAASMVEVGQTITTWPQLGGDIVLGAATMTAAVRRLGLGEHLPSGRIRIDLGEHLDGLQSPTVDDPAPQVPEHAAPAPAPAPDTAVEGVLEAVRLAPSGGNIQPWTVMADTDSVRIYLARERTTTMDVHHRGSYVAIGAALYNAQVAAAAAGILGTTGVCIDGPDPDLVAVLHLGAGTDRQLARYHSAMLGRHTNRSLARPMPLDPATESALREAAQRQGAQVQLITDTATLHAAGEVLAAADRVRYLTPQLHQEMIGELQWAGRDRLDVGIDVRTLELDDADLATLEIARRPDVMATLAEWGRGQSLGADTRSRIAASSALAVVTVPGCAPEDFVRGGSAVEAVWVCAQIHKLAVQPMSPVFLYGLDSEDLNTLSPSFAAELGTLQSSFRTIVKLGTDRTIALVMRLSHSSTVTTRSQRLPLAAITRSSRGRGSGSEHDKK